MFIQTEHLVLRFISGHSFSSEVFVKQDTALWIIKFFILRPQLQEFYEVEMISIIVLASVDKRLI